MSGGLLATGRNMENSAMRGLLSAAEMESQRNIANDNIKAQEKAAAKSRNSTVAGIGAYAAPSIAGALAPAGATSLAGAGMATSMLGTGATTSAITGGSTFAPMVSGMSGMAANGTAIGSTVAAETALTAAAPVAAETAGTLTAAGSASAVPIVGWIAAAGLAAYSLGSMFDWW